MPVKPPGDGDRIDQTAGFDEFRRADSEEPIGFSPRIEHGNSFRLVSKPPTTRSIVVGAKPTYRYRSGSITDRIASGLLRITGPNCLLFGFSAKRLGIKQSGRLFSA
jgi:hypothetical protein